MGVLKRLFDISKAAANEALDKLEKPVMMMNHYLRSMEEEIQSVEQALIREAAVERRLEQQIAECSRLAEQSEHKAAQAVQDDRSVEARQALEAKLTYLEKASEYTQAYEQSRLRSGELAQQLNKAKAEYEAMQTKREELAARARKTEAKTAATMPSFSSGVDTGSAARGFQRIESTILQKEAQIEIAESMKAAAAASRNALIEEQLNRLKASAPQQ